MPERLSNLGYFALKKQSDKDVALTPDTYIPMYNENVLTNMNVHEDNPIVGNKMARFQVLPGLRTHMGDVQLLAEPNTLGYLLDMLLTKGSTTGSDPYTHPFTLSNSTDPNAYTVDILKGQIVYRFIGVEASALGFEFDNNKMLVNVSLAGRAAFSMAKITNVASLVLTLSTAYDPTPTNGLVAGDLIRLFKADGSVVDTTITSVDSATTITVGSATGVAANDYVALRGATPSFSLLDPFLWARTEFRFGATASAALSATHTGVYDGSVFKIIHQINNDSGEARSGSFDPATLARKQGDVEVNTKFYFDTPDDYERYLAVAKRALVIRCFSGTSYELRVTINNLRQRENPPLLQSGDLIYTDVKYAPAYDTSDGQGFDVKILNAVSSI